MDISAGNVYKSLNYAKGGEVSERTTQASILIQGQNQSAENSRNTTQRPYVQTQGRHTANQGSRQK